MNERRRRRALITRPQEDSADAAIALARRGITPVLAPMMRIEYAAAEIENEISLAQAVLFTSRNGVRAFTRLSARRDMAVFAVGDSTAALARDNGFIHIESAHGDSTDLARLVTERLDPADGLLFHAAGATVAGELVETLNKAGFKTVRRALYEAKPVDTLADDTVMALRDRTLDYVLFFSPRTAGIFCDLVNDAGLTMTCDSLVAICLSDAVAAEISGIEWKSISIANAPTTDALLAILDNLEGEGPRTPEARTAPAAAPAARASVPGSVRGPAEEPVSEPPVETPVKIKADAKPKAQPGKPADMPAREPAGAPQPPSDNGTRNNGGSLIRSLPVAALLALAVLAAGYLTLPSWRDRLPVEVREHLAGTDPSATTLRRDKAELQARIDDLDRILIAANAELATTRKTAEQEIDGLKSRLAAAEKAAAASATETAQANGALTEKVAALERALATSEQARNTAEQRANAAATAHAAAAQEAASVTGALNQKMAGLEKDLALSREALLTAGKSDTIALAAGKLRDAVTRAAPFTEEIAALKRLGGNNPDIASAIASIEPFAAQGVPSRATLFNDLGKTVKAVLAAPRNSPGTGWIDLAAEKLTGFVTVRRIDGKGTGVEPILARAEIAARRGDLAAAVKELSALTGTAAGAAAPWLKPARSRLAAEDASAALDRVILAAFAKGAN